MSVKMRATPEKVKSLLSSFLASSKQQTTEKNAGGGGLDTSTPCAVTTTTTPVNRPVNSVSSNLRSFESFIDRLDTFSPLTWFGKPAELSPLVCARYGWSNVEADSLQCVGCKAYLCGKLPSQADTEAYKSFKEKLKKDVHAAHGKFCVLAANPCPEHFCVIACDDPTSLLSDFNSRVVSLRWMTHHLPTIAYSTLHSLGYDEGQGAAYCKRVLLPDSETSPEVMTLSVTGWSGMPGKTDMLTCSKCRRQVGVWNFVKESDHSLYGNGNGVAREETDQDEPDVKRPKLSAKPSFNPVEEHKHWCPWKQMTSPSVTANLTDRSCSPVGGKRARDDHPPCPAFIVALKTIAPGLLDNNTGLAHAMKVSPVTDGLRCFRRVIKAWSSPKSRSVSDTPAKPAIATSPQSHNASS